MVRVEYVLESWRSVRLDTIAAVEDFPAAEFAYRPAPDVMTFGETARHILGAGHGLMGLMLSGEDNFATPDFREKMMRHAWTLPENAGQAEIARALRDSIDERTAQLAARPPEFFAHIMTRMDGQRVTRLEMLLMVKEHEMTHRAQLFLCLRIKGIVPATTRRRMAKQAAR
jgi:uncharacterized damage-inducible protein DinB